jgi:ankyrin repeat protein
MNDTPPDFLYSLTQAAESYDFDGIFYLLNEGAHPDSPLGDDTLLTWLVRQGQEKLVHRLFEFRADVDLADKAGNTPLIHAAQLGMQEIVEALVEAGADPFRRNSAGKTAYEAAQQARQRVFHDIDDPNADVSSIESHVSRLARITLILEEAEVSRALKNEIDSCHLGAPKEVAITPPLKFKGNAP